MCGKSYKIFLDPITALGYKVQNIVLLDGSSASLAVKLYAD